MDEDEVYVVDTPAMPGVPPAFARASSAATAEQPPAFARASSPAEEPPPHVVQRRAIQAELRDIGARAALAGRQFDPPMLGKAVHDLADLAHRLLEPE